ncbi:DUF1801 domain-containing protein [Myxococcus sp. K15C18031901]|uniref:DUF1801 domain-containing protein n=1 Tax=Myxococcus dinghuensis TaxID=2906761 RepID=UPI0020A7D37C|nr:DUF1801 domain-containing protein [Myxococcus dinghuensis]MCP3103461.1 DUF1801 domain-containing protein [Myxococcus dinghuensis]
MANRAEAVDRYMLELEHPLKEEVERVRAAILASDRRITERIKWNAPSFGYTDDRVTFKLQPKHQFQLIFHRGAKVKDSQGFSFEDASGLLRWAAADRAVVTLRDAQDVRAKLEALVEVVKLWMDATS